MFPWSEYQYVYVPGSTFGLTHCRWRTQFDHMMHLPGAKTGPDRLIITLWPLQKIACTQYMLVVHIITAIIVGRYKDFDRRHYFHLIHGVNPPRDTDVE